MERGQHCGTNSAAAAPCASRAATSPPIEPANPRQAEAAVKASTPQMNTGLRLRTSPRRPPVMTSAA